MFVFVDSAANTDQAPAVQSVKEIVESTSGFAHLDIRYADHNRGTAGSIVPGVTEIVNRFGCVVVVEDDVVVSSTFLSYMKRALERYSSHPRVMSISGYMFETPDSSNLPETFFYRKATSIGWGTHAHSWQQLELDGLQLLEKIQSQGLMGTLDIEGALKLSEIIRRDAKHGRLDPATSWSPRWFASIIGARGLCLYPRYPLVKNIGFDGSGARSPVSHAWDVTLTSSFDPVHLPNDIAEHELAHSIMCDAYQRVHAARQRGE